MAIGFPPTYPPPSPSTSKEPIPRGEMIEAIAEEASILMIVGREFQTARYSERGASSLCIKQASHHIARESAIVAYQFDHSGL